MDPSAKRGPSRGLRWARDAAAIVVLGGVLALTGEALARWTGFGAAPAPPPSRPGVARVVALGGSTVAGVPLGELGFARQLALGLEALAPGPVELVNLARPGADSAAVLRAAERALATRTDLLVVLTGHNEFLAPRPRTGLRGALQRVRDRSALVALGEAAALRLGLAGGAPEPFPERVPAIDRDGALFRDTLDAYRAHLAALVALARERGVPLLLCTAPSNHADWPPVHDAVPPPGPGYARAIGALEEALRAGRPEPVLREAARLRERFGDDAMLAYLEGRAHRARGALDLARERFHHAKERDPWPLRALDAQNQAVRALAGPGVRVVDAERLFAARDDDGLVGFDWFCDNCHPTPRANAVLARAIAGALAEEGWILPPGVAVGDAVTWLARAEARITAHGGAEALARTRLRWLLSNALYAMKTPFHNTDAARAYLERARAMAPGDWRVTANLGVVALLEGDTEQGRRLIARATAQRGARLDPADRNNLPYLEAALRRTGVSLPEAATPPGAGGS